MTIASAFSANCNCEAPMHPGSIANKNGRIIQTEYGVGVACDLKETAEPIAAQLRLGGAL